MKQRRGTVRRIITRVCIFLLLGAIVNVAVAWGCALWTPRRFEDYRGYLDNSLIETRWSDIVVQFPPYQDLHAHEKHFIGHSYLHVGCLTTTGIAQNHQQWRSGWPGRSFIGEKRIPGDDGGSWLRYNWTDFNHSVPLRPLWPGFALNTVFYALLLWPLLAAPGIVRRRRRLKRGLCPACAYPIGTSPVCTECGKELPERCTV